MNLNTIENEKANPFGLEVESDFHNTRKDITISLLSKYLSGNKNCCILDVGCGKGIITRSIKEHFPEAIMDAIDISEKAIHTASSDISGINFYKTDAADYYPAARRYDAIILNNIYEHVENPLIILESMKRILKDNGVIIISTPNRYHIKNIFRVVLGLSIKIPYYHVTEYSIGQLYDHHNYAGLRIEKVLTPKFKFEKFRLINFILISLLQPLVDSYLRFRKSNNRTGSLLFIISKIK